MSISNNLMTKCPLGDEFTETGSSKKESAEHEDTTVPYKKFYTTSMAYYKLYGLRLKVLNGSRQYVFTGIPIEFEAHVNNVIKLMDPEEDTRLFQFITPKKNNDRQICVRKHPNIFKSKRIRSHFTSKLAISIVEHEISEEGLIHKSYPSFKFTFDSFWRKEHIPLALQAIETSIADEFKFTPVEGGTIMRYTSIPDFDTKRSSTSFTLFHDPIPKDTENTTDNSNINPTQNTASDNSQKEGNWNLKKQKTVLKNLIKFAENQGPRCDTLLDLNSKTIDIQTASSNFHINDEHLNLDCSRSSSRATFSEIYHSVSNSLTLRTKS